MDITTHDIEDLIDNEHIDKSEPLFFDVETVGLYGRIRLAQFYFESWDTVIVCENPDVNKLIEFLDTCHIISHNIHYEITTIQQQSKSAWIPKRFDCTFLLSKLHFYAKDSHSLDNCLTYVLKEDVYGNKKEMQESDWSVDELTQEQVEYAAKDVYYLPKIWNEVKKSLNSNSYQLDKITLDHCLDFQNNGLPVDRTILDAKVIENLAAIEKINLSVNANSPKQVKEYLEHEGSCDDENLAYMIVVEGNEKAQDVRQTRKLLKQNSFCKKFITDDNRIYGKFLPAPKNGRLSCKDQNLQQIPRELKNLFGMFNYDNEFNKYKERLKQQWYDKKKQEFLASEKCLWLKRQDMKFRVGQISIQELIDNPPAEEQFEIQKKVWLKNKDLEWEEKIKTSPKLIWKDCFLPFYPVPRNDTADNKVLPAPKNGRLSCKDQNLQQIPRELKNLFGLGSDNKPYRHEYEDGTTSPDYSFTKTLVYADFSQLEIRALCAIIGEPVMEDIYRVGGDLHEHTAKSLFGSGFTKEQRTIAKTANFALLYGAGANTFKTILLKQAGIYLRENEARQHIKEWKKLYPTLARWQRSGIDAWENGTCWETPLGRKYKARMMTDQLNIRISGFGAEVSKLALHYIYKSKKPEHLVCNVVHDSYMLEVPYSDYKEVAKLIGDSMQKAWVEMSKRCIIKDLPLPVDVLVGYNWGDIEDGKNIYKLSLD